MQIGRLGSSVLRRDADEDVFGAAFGVFHEDVEVPVLVEDAGVEQLVLHLLAGAAAIRLDQVAVRVGRLRVLVEILHVRVGRGAVEIKVVLLDVLAVVAFAVGQSEQPLLENRILAVPEGQAETEALPIVGDAGDAVLAPSVGAGAGMIVGEGIPGVARLAVVLAHGAPLPFAQIWPPRLPCAGTAAGFFEATVFVDDRRSRYRRNCAPPKVADSSRRSTGRCQRKQMPCRAGVKSGRMASGGLTSLIGNRRGRRNDARSAEMESPGMPETAAGSFAFGDLLQEGDRLVHADERLGREQVDLRAPRR